MTKETAHSHSPRPAAAPKEDEVVTGALISSVANGQKLPQLDEPSMWEPYATDLNFDFCTNATLNVSLTSKVANSKPPKNGNFLFRFKVTLL